MCSLLRGERNERRWWWKVRGVEALGPRWCPIRSDGFSDCCWTTFFLPYVHTMHISITHGTTAQHMPLPYINQHTYIHKVSAIRLTNAIMFVERARSLRWVNRTESSDLCVPFFHIYVMLCSQFTYIQIFIYAARVWKEGSNDDGECVWCCMVFVKVGFVGINKWENN